MTNRLKCVFVVAILAIGCGAGEEPSVDGTGLVDLLPTASSMDGWQIADGPTEYDSEGLFEYLNGGAPLYLDFGFQGMVHVRYQLGDDPLASVTLDVFDMGSELGAFGLYRSGRPPEAEVRPWGAEGYRSGTVAATWKGSVSIQAQADDEQPELIEAMEALVARVADSVDGGTSLPQIIDVLPSEGLAPTSERLVAKDLMSHAFLPGGVLATYRVADDEGTVFFSDLKGEIAVTEAMAGLRAHHEQWGEIVDEIDLIGDGGFQFSDPGLGSGAVVSTGSYVVGVHGGLSSDVQMDLLGRLVDSLASSPME
ncbi:MAG: hypothetical protein IFJ97_01825 [Acidobacteria bacterium]|uniref:Uncharacterized protein n=1 Tax=Candidatus Sulfomarinibacter kjeldsenii TaxID=2885994 RepID=A0A8J7C470_9BACT|nr:hypothetical protein [Candidatus Sulfomarinibacter kjeldsenii]